MTVEETIAAAVADALGERFDAMDLELAELREQLALGPMPERLLTRQAAAEAMSCSVRTIDAMLAAGAPVVRLGGPAGSPRLMMSELIAYLRARGHAAPLRVVGGSDG